MLTDFIKSLLKKQGYIVAKGPKPEEKKVDVGFLNAVNEAISSYCKTEPSYEWANPKEIRKYLTTDRIYLYQKLVEICLECNLHFNDKSIADFGAGMCVLHRKIADISSPACLDAYDNFAELRDLALTISPSTSFSSENITSVVKKYDSIFCMEVLEHMLDPTAAIVHMHSLLRTSGNLVLSVPNGRFDFQEAGKMREDGDSYWGHVHFWSPESWELFVRNIGLEDVQIETGNITEKHLYAIISKNNT